MARTIDNGQDIMDSRDVIERFEELEAERDAAKWEGPGPDAEGDAVEAPFAAECGDDFTDDWDDELESEYQSLKALCEEGEGYGDWEGGETLIRDSYFERYAQEFAEDIGAIDPTASWPNNCIDWERAARELQYDYTSIDFDGVDYWVRS
jgi:hypothetical protein